MIKSFNWKNIGDKFYFYEINTGKIVGFVHKYAHHDVWIAVVYKGEYAFTVDTEVHLGQYIDFTFAQNAVQHYWEIQNRTLIEE